MSTAGVHRSAHVDVEPGRFVEVGPRLLGREDRPARHDQVVDAGTRQGAGDVGRHVRRDPGPRRELVARQPQPDDPVGARPVARRGDHPTGEQQAVLTPLVVALVGEPAQELADQAVLAGIDLHAVEVGLGRQLGGVPEPVDHRLDVVGLHPLRHLTGVGLRHARGRPQRRLAVRRRSLPAGMIERGDHERPVRPAGLRHGPPSRGASFGEGGPLVGPVRAVDRCALDHHRAAPSRGTPLVVGDVAGGQ